MHKTKMKTISRIKNMLLRPILSPIGYHVLKQISESKEPLSWRQDFEAKRVLIVGTGPSIDRIPGDFLTKYDVKVFLNYALNFCDAKNGAYFFSVDTGVVQRLWETPHRTKLNVLGKNRCIIAPFFLEQVPFLNRNFQSTFTWLVPGEVQWEMPLLRVPFLRSLEARIIPSPPVLTPKDISINILSQWHKSHSNTIYFPVIRTTSALSAILFVSKYMPICVDLIGCDFGYGRAKNLESDLGVVKASGFLGAKERFMMIKDFLKPKGVDVNNLSWTI